MLERVYTSFGQLQKSSNKFKRVSKSLEEFIAVCLNLKESK